MDNIFISTPIKETNNIRIINENYEDIFKNYAIYEQNNYITCKYPIIQNNNYNEPLNINISKIYENPQIINKRVHTPLINAKRIINKKEQKLPPLYNNIDYSYITDISYLPNNNFNVDNNNNCYHNYISKSPEPVIRRKKKKKDEAPKTPVYTKNIQVSNYNNNYYNYNNFNENRNNYNNHITNYYYTPIRKAIKLEKIINPPIYYNYNHTEIPSNPFIYKNEENKENNDIKIINDDIYKVTPIKNIYQQYISKSPIPLIRSRVKVKKIYPENQMNNPSNSKYPKDSRRKVNNINNLQNIKKVNRNNKRNIITKSYDNKDHYLKRNINPIFYNANGDIIQQNNKNINNNKKLFVQNMPVNYQVNNQQNNIISQYNKNFYKNNNDITYKQKSNDIISMPSIIKVNILSKSDNKNNMPPNIITLNNLKNNNNNNTQNNTNNNSNIIPNNYTNVCIEPSNNFIPEEFIFLQQIGEGSFGKIYSTQWIRNKNKYAMKKIYIDNLNEIQRIKEKISIMQQFRQKTNYNGVIKVYGDIYRKTYENTYEYYILMELAQSDWYKEIKNRMQYLQYYSEYELLQIINQLIYTFALLQKNHISHRDIKPQNILIINNIYKICDFGEARILKGNGLLVQTIRGSELYMSPILFYALNNGLTQIIHNTFKSDVFSLGMCFLLSGSLKNQSLYELRETNNMNVVTNVVNKYLGGIYSSKIIKIILLMLQIEEKLRPDFIQLEQEINNIW